MTQIVVLLLWGGVLGPMVRPVVGCSHGLVSMSHVPELALSAVQLDAVAASLPQIVRHTQLSRLWMDGQSTPVWMSQQC